MEDNEDVRAKERSERVRKLQNELIGPRYEGANFKSINLGEHKQPFISWINGQKNFLVFLAPPGIGKTYLCSALIEKFYGKLENFRYWQEIDLISALKEHMHRHNHISTLKMLIDCDFLMYDDLCSSMVTDWKTEVLFSLINIRYISKKPTIITSNLSKQGLIEALPSRATSRLFAKENLIIEIQNGQDLRAHGY